MVRAKALAAWRAGLIAIVCIGETKDRADAGQTLRRGRRAARRLAARMARSPDNLVIAYEPVWAIGTGLTPTPADVAEVHGFIRERLTKRFGETGDEIRILYGGSVKPANAKELLGVANVDGALVGGASLKADGFPRDRGGIPADYLPRGWKCREDRVETPANSYMTGIGALRARSPWTGLRMQTVSSSSTS